MSWGTNRMGDLTVKIGSGVTPRGGKSVYVAEGVALVRSQNVLDNRLEVSDVARLPDDVADSMSNVAVHPGDVLLNITGDSIARCALVNIDLGPARVNQHVAIIRTSPMLDPWFLQRTLTNPPMKQHLLTIANGGGTRAALTKAQISNLLIPVPPIPVQRAIAEVLGALDDKIAVNRTLSAAAESRAAAMFAATGMLEEPQTLRGAVRLVEMVEINPTMEKPPAGEPVYVDMQKLPTSSMSITDWTHRAGRGGARFQNGDTLLARITPCLENRKTGFVDFLADGEVGLGSTEYIVMRSRDSLPAIASYFIATSVRFRSAAIQRMRGTSGRQRVSAAELTDFELSVPHAGRFAAFSAVADPSVKLIGSLRDENRVLADLRDALLPALMSGKLRVKDAEKQAEAAV